MAEVNNFEVRIYNMDGSTPAEFSDLLTLSTDEVGEITDVDWTLNCYCSPSVLDALRAWRRQVYDPDTERMGLPSEYMRQVFFVRYDGQGNERDVIRCPGTWIGALKNGSQNQQGGEVVKVQVPFIISRAIYLTRSDLQ